MLDDCPPSRLVAGWVTLARSHPPAKYEEMPMLDLTQLREAALHGIEGLMEVTAHAPRARRNLMLGLWAGQRIGHVGPALARYALSVLESDHEEAGDADVIRKLMGDFAGAGLPQQESEVRERLIAFKRDAFVSMRETD